MCNVYCVLDLVVSSQLAFVVVTRHDFKKCLVNEEA